MKNHIYLLTFFLLVTNSYSQKKSNVKCGFFGNKSVEERSQIFPFNESKKIVLVSYLNSEIIEDVKINTKEVIRLKDSSSFSNAGYKIVKEFSFLSNDTLPEKVYDVTKIVELNQNAIDEFSNWIINYDYKIKNPKKPVLSSLATCYIPRNAVVFLNEKDIVISILEICFECGHYYLLPDPNNFGSTLGLECDERLDYFKNFFIGKGFDLQ
ncbi:hypothetical protein [Flavobacterium chungnamense]|uniref:Uncharacterized protein n=1 Tax=Flavobacterium chungnamense TaxID=706182 RepID=A0ABP7UD15_9FLAO